MLLSLPQVQVYQSELLGLRPPRELLHSAARQQLGQWWWQQQQQQLWLAAGFQSLKGKEKVQLSPNPWSTIQPHAEKLYLLPIWP